MHLTIYSWFTIFLCTMPTNITLYASRLEAEREQVSWTRENHELYHTYLYGIPWYHAILDSINLTEYNDAIYQTTQIFVAHIYDGIDTQNFPPEYQPITFHKAQLALCSLTTPPAKRRRASRQSQQIAAYINTIMGNPHYLENALERSLPIILETTTGTHSDAVVRQTYAQLVDALNNCSDAKLFLETLAHSQPSVPE